MKILIDMNLSPAWVRVFEEAGHSAIHWSTIGSLNAPEGPSVIQIRAQDISPSHAKDLLINIINKFTENLLQGVLISVDEEKSRVRLLPLRRDKTE
jgi:predicted nuclease of predicted toxin-antitoxin system